MVEIYQTLNSNYLNKQNFFGREYNIRNYIEVNDYSSSLSFDYFTTITNDFNEEIRINKERFAKTTSISSLRSYRENSSKQSNLELKLNDDANRLTEYSDLNFNDKFSKIKYRIKSIKFNSEYNDEYKNKRFISKRKYSSPNEILTITKDNFTVINNTEKENVCCSVFEKHHKNNQQDKNISKTTEKFQSCQISEEEQKKIKELLIEQIMNSRKSAVNLIIRNYRLHKQKQAIKQENLISLILNYRKESSTLIQSVFRSYLVRKNIKVILEKLEENYLFIYDYNTKYFQNPKSNNINKKPADKLKCITNKLNEDNKNSSHSTKESEEIESNEEDIIHDIKLKLINKKSKNEEILLNFVYSKYLKCYILTFKKKGLIRKNYKVNFIVNGNTIIDPRFKLNADEDGKFYNIIESHMLMIKNKIKSYENKLKYSIGNRNNFNTNYILEDNKYWEDIFKIKKNNYRNLNTNSISDISETHEVDKIFSLKKNIYSCNTPIIASSPSIKPILRKQNSENLIPRKTVSFNDNVQISFFSI